MTKEMFEKKETTFPEKPFELVFFGIRLSQKIFFLIVLGVWGTAALGLNAENLSNSGSLSPPVPTGFVAAAQDISIRLSWDKPTLEGIRFNVYLTDESGKNIHKLTTQPISDNWLLLAKIKPTRIYYLVLTAMNSEGLESQATAPLEAQLEELQKPDTDSDSVTEEDSNSKEEDTSKEPFKPNWNGQLAYTFSSQNSMGQAEINQELSLTGTYNLTESGHYFSVVSGGGQETLEGSPTSYGTFSAEGGLGLGVFKPSLEIVFQQGAQALNSYDGSLNLNFQIIKALEIGPLFEINPESHQGPLSEVLRSNSDKIDEIDSVDWTAGLVATVTPWDFLEFSLTGEEDFSRTYMWQNILHTAQHDLNETERIPSGTLAVDLTFLTDFILVLSLQEGLEYFPAGINYSPILKKTVNFATPTTESFSEYSIGLTYNL